MPKYIVDLSIIVEFPDPDWPDETGPEGVVYERLWGEFGDKNILINDVSTAY